MAGGVDEARKRRPSYLRGAGVSVIRTQPTSSKTKGVGFCVLFEKTTSLYRGVGCETNIKKPFFCGRAFVLVYRVVSEMSSMAETSVEISPMLGAQ